MAKINRIMGFLIVALGGLIFATITAPVYAAGTFELSPSIMTVPRSCNSSITIRETILSGASNAADIIVTYDPTSIEILDSDPATPGVQILPGNAYESYAGNTVNTSTGEIRIVGYSATSTLTTTANFATIRFKSKPLATSGFFTFTFTGSNPYATLDSNIADASNSFDMLQSVTNATITFTSGGCATDNISPQIGITSPANFSSAVAPNSPVIFTLNDTGAGIDLSTLSILINGVTYSSLSPGITISGTPASYTITLYPSVPFPVNQQSVITISVNDLSGNNKVNNITINAGYSCPPNQTIIKYQNCSQEITPTTPTPTNPVDTSPTIKLITTDRDHFSKENPKVTFEISDANGLSPESFLLRILDTSYSILSTPESIEVTGTKTSYKFTVKLITNSKLNSATGKLTAQVKISDLTGNTRIENFLFDTGKLPILPTDVSEVPSISKNLLFTTLVAAVLLSCTWFGFVVSKPILLKTKNGSGHLLPFVYAQFISEKDGHRYRVPGGIFGNIRAKIPPGQYRLFLQKNGYQTVSQTFTIDYLGKFQTLTIQLKQLV